MPDDEIAALATEIDDGKDDAQDQAGRNLQDREDGTPDQGDGAEGEGQDEGPDEVADEPQRRPSRRDARIERLIAARDADKERADRLERQVQELNAAQQRTQTRQETPEEESGRMALMTPDERSEYRLNKALRQIEQSNQRTQFLAAETADKAAFEAKAQSDPLYAKLAPDVEKELATLRGQGQNVPREILMTLAVGRLAMAARGKKNGQTARGAAKLARETTAPLNGKGDQTANRRRSNDTPAKRLQDVQI